MKTLLASFAKTMPKNHHWDCVEVDPEVTPGSTCTDDQWEKAKRMESEYYDWESYMKCQVPVVEHPVYTKRIEDHLTFEQWEEILKKLEPLPRHP